MTHDRTRHPFFVHRAMRHVTAVLERAAVGPGPVLLGVSGGSDSMALLELIGLLAPARALELHVVCVDHGLRAEAAAESELVRLAAGRWGAAFHPVAVVPEGDDEDSLRRARHAAIEQTRVQVGARFALLGHTADDQIETIVFRFLRGAGFGGLAGMREARGTLVRPLLALRREDLRRILVARGVRWADDPSNSSPRYARGRLRSSVLPAVEEAFGRGALDHLLDVAPRWRSDEEFLERETERLLAYACRRGRGGLDLDVEALLATHEALRARALRRWISEASGKQPASREIAEVERWLEGAEGQEARKGSLDVAGARLTLAGGRLSIEGAERSRDGIDRLRGIRR
jgi:tRNA(Ile)-lysidine synthase